MVQKNKSVKRLKYIGNLFFVYGIINFIIVFFLMLLNSFTITSYFATDPLQKKDLLFLTEIFFFGILGVSFSISGTLILLKTLDYQNGSHDKPDIEHRVT